MKFHFSCNSLKPALTVLQDELARLDVSSHKHADGYVEIPSGLGAEKRSKIESSISRYGLGIIDDDRECLVQHIKNILFDIVYGRNHPKATLSNYLSEKLGYSYGFLSALFAKTTFCSIEQYFILIRIERAKQLMIQDELTLKQVCDALAYSSFGHFSKQFRKCTGITLSEFKKIIIRRKNGNN